MDIGEKLQEIFELRILQNKVLVYRNENEAINGNNIKKTLKKDMQNLINADITLEQAKIKLPDSNTVPPLCAPNLDHVDFAEVLVEQRRTMEALEMFDEK